jgi:hypothetical protein
VVEEARRQLSPEVFARAASAFDAAHAEDPSGHAAAYHAALVRWVERLAPDASAALLLAARCQHLRREETPRSAFPEGVLGYKKWRANAALEHQKRAAALLERAGVEEAVVRRVGELLIKKGLRSDPEVMTFEDAIALTFLEVDFAPFAAKHPAEKVVDILKKTWAKMTPAGQDAALALAPSLPADLRALLERALG